MPKRPERPAEESDDEEEEAKNTADSESATSSDSAVTDGSDDDSGAASNEETSMSREVEVDIEFFDPKEQDFHGIKALLEDLLGGAALNTSQLADAIIAQKRVGTVVKSGEDEEPIGLTTALSLKRYASLEALSQIKAHLQQSCAIDLCKQQLAKVLEDGGTGLIINQRVVNCPPQISPPMMQALFDEINWATEDEPTEELRDSFKFRQYLVLGLAYCDPQAAPQHAHKPSKKKAKISQVQAEELIAYSKPEDEYFHRHCSWSFTYPADKKGLSEDDLQPMRLVMCLKPDQIKAARNDLDIIIGNIASKSNEAQS